MDAVQKTSTKPFADLPRLQRNAVRTVARESWLNRSGTQNQAILTALERLPRHVGRDYLPIGESLAAQLIRYWAANHVREPESIGVPGEPGWEADK
jgi:hypothetical protein